MPPTTVALVTEDGDYLTPLGEGGEVGLGLGEQHVGVVSERFFVAPSQTIFRPANTTAYAALDIIGDSATAALVSPLTFNVSRRRTDPVTLERMRLYTSDTALALGIQVRAFFFRDQPISGAADNVKLTMASLTGGNRSFVGSMTGSFVQNDSDTSLVFSDGGFAILVPDAGSRIIFTPSDGRVHCFVQALAAFTPSANSTSLTGIVEGFQGHA